MGRAKALSVATSSRIVLAARRTSQPVRLECRDPLRGRLMVGRLTLDQVVKVRVLAPQLNNATAQRAFAFLGWTRKSGGGNAGGNTSRR
jgi:hypothetical protein